MAFAPFDASRLKLLRAEKHLADLAAVIDRFVELSPFTLSLEPHPTFPGRQLLTLAAGAPPPTNIALITGDAVHNIRTALDLLASDLVKLEGKSVNHVYFPVSDREENLEKQIKEKNFKRASADSIKLLKELQPYTGGHPYIRGLRDLDVTDKHKLIVPIFQIAFVEHLVIRTPEGGMKAYSLVRLGQLAQWDFSEGTTVESRGIRPELGFASAPFVSMPVLETLRTALASIRGVVERFAALYPAYTSKIALILPEPS